MTDDSSRVFCLSSLVHGKKHIPDLGCGWLKTAFIMSLKLIIVFFARSIKTEHVLDVLASDFSLCPVNFTEVLLWHLSD